MSLLVAWVALGWVLTASDATPGETRVLSRRGITIEVPAGWHVVQEDEEIERVRSFEKAPDGSIRELEAEEDLNVLEVLKYEEPIPTLNVGFVIGVEPRPENSPRDPFVLAQLWCQVTSEQGVGTEIVAAPSALLIDGRPAGLCHTSGTVVGGGRPMRSLRWSYFLYRGDELVHIEAYCPPEERAALGPVLERFLDRVVIAETREL